MIIFQAKYLQAFVEMEDIGSAIKAKENLEISIDPSVNLTILYIEQKDFFLNHQSHLQNSPLINMPDMTESMYYSMPEIHSPYGMQQFSPLNQLIPTPPGMIGSPTYRIKPDYWGQQMFESMSPLYSHSPSVLQEEHMTFNSAFERISTNIDLENESFDRPRMKMNNSYNSHIKGSKECNIVLV